MRRCIGLDVHREFAEVAIWEEGVVRSGGQIKTMPEALRLFAESLCVCDEVAIEATCKTHAIARLLERHVARVVVSNPMKTRAIAEAKVKTDEVDARVLAELLAADYLPGVWIADDETHALRRQVARRAHIVRQRTRLKNRVQSILHRNLVPRCPAADLFGHKGPAWLAEQDLPLDERRAVEALLRQLDFYGEELRLIDAELARVGLRREEVKRLMTIPGVDATVALSIVAAVGDFSRFRSPERLVSYLGLNPRVRQSGGQPASHGRITKQGGRTRAGCSSKPPGRQPRLPARCAPSTNASAPGAHADRRRRDRPQAGRALLAPDRTRRGLRLRPPLAPGAEAAQARAPRRHALTPRPTRLHPRLQPERSARTRTRAQRTRRDRLPAVGRRLASESAQESGRGCRHRGATLRPSSGNPARQGFHPHAPLFGPGSPAPATKRNAR